MAGDLRVVGSNSGRNLKRISDPVLPQKFPAIDESVPLIIDFARRAIKIKKKLVGFFLQCVKWCDGLILWVWPAYSCSYI